jgi:hypothetical protein
MGVRDEKRDRDLSRHAEKDPSPMSGDNLRGGAQLTEEGPWARPGGGEGRVRGEESVVVALAMPKSREGAIEGHTLGRGARNQGEQREARGIGFGVRSSYSRDQMNVAYLGSK